MQDLLAKKYVYANKCNFITIEQWELQASTNELTNGNFQARA